MSSTPPPKNRGAKSLPPQHPTFFGVVEEMMQQVMDGNPKALQAFYSSLLVGLFTFTVFILFYWCVVRRKPKGRTVIIAGTCEAGKTAIFSRLVHQKTVETYTSAKENSGSYSPPGSGKPLELVDVPGNERLRQKFVNQFKHSTRGVLYVVDASNIQKQLRDTTEYLFNILADPVIFASKTPILIMCNKQDVGVAKSANVVRRELEKEINLLRDTHSKTLQGTDDIPVVNHMFLGREGQDFKFDDLKMKVEFCECSSGAENVEGLDHVENWLAKIAA